jgi:hypothetical protein
MLAGMKEHCYLEWKGRRAWVQMPSATLVREYGEIMHVFHVRTPDADIELAIELPNGAARLVRVSQKGTLWDLAD